MRGPVGFHTDVGDGIARVYGWCGRSMDPQVWRYGRSRSGRRYADDGLTSLGCRMCWPYSYRPGCQCFGKWARLKGSGKYATFAVAYDGAHGMRWASPDSHGLCLGDSCFRREVQVTSRMGYKLELSVLGQPLSGYRSYGRDLCVGGMCHSWSNCGEHTIRRWRWQQHLPSVQSNAGRGNLLDGHDAILRFRLLELFNSCHLHFQYDDLTSATTSTGGLSRR